MYINNYQTRYSLNTKKNVYDFGEKLDTLSYHIDDNMNVFDQYRMKEVINIDYNLSFYIVVLILRYLSICQK